MNLNKNNIIFPIEFNFLKGGMLHSACTLINALKKDYNIYILAYEKAEIFDVITDVNHLKLKKDWSISILSPVNTIRTHMEVREILKGFSSSNTLTITNNVGSELIFSGFGFNNVPIRRIFVSRGGNYSGKTGFFLKMGFKSVIKFIAISNHQIKILISKGVKKESIKLIHNGVETNNFKPKPRTNVIESIGIVGFIHPLKNQLLAIKAIKILKERGYKINLNIYGLAFSSTDKEYKKIIDLYIEENDLLNDIIFKGYVSNKDEIFNHNDILLSCSLAEGFGRTVVEGMAYSLPCIGLTESGGVLDIITNNYDGILINNSEQELVDVILKLFNDNEFREMIAVNAFNTYSAKFTDEIMCNKYKLFLEEVFCEIENKSL